MAKTVSKASLVSTSTQNTVSNNSDDNILSTSSNITTYNGMNVYVADYCPICHRITKVETSDGTIIDVVTGDTTSSAEESTTDTSSNTKKYTNNPSSSNTTTVLAENVIEDSSHRFVTEELLQNTLTVIDQYMSKIIYDVDNDGVVDISKTTKNVDRVEWNSIQNVPDPLTDLQGLKNLLIHHHHHRNLDVLREFGEDINGNPTWKFKEWPFPQTAKPNQLSAPYLRNIFIALSEPRNSQIGDIWLDVETFDSQLIKGLYIKKEDGTWYRWLADDIKSDVIEKIQRAILNLSHENLSHLYGGSLGNHYHITESTYNFIEQLKEDSTKEDEQLVIITKEEYQHLIDLLEKYQNGSIVETDSQSYHTLSETEYETLKRVIKEYNKEHINPHIVPDDGTGTDDVDDMSEDETPQRELTEEEYEEIENLCVSLNMDFSQSWGGFETSESSTESIDTTSLTKEQYYTLRRILKMYNDGLIVYTSHWYNIENYYEDFDRYPDLDSYQLTELQISKLLELIKYQEDNDLDIIHDWGGI